MKLMSLRINFASNAIREEVLDGRTHLVVPMAMAVEGVMDGSDGPLLYTGEEFAKTQTVWNHKPIVVYHPMMNGMPISACDPAVINSHRVGIILASNYDNSTSKLRAEAWLDKEKLAKVDPRVSQMLANGEKVEVSTGLFCQKEAKAGNFNGKNYVGVATNYMPDHLAILPDMEGASSIKDGAGLLANASNGYGKKDRAKYARKGWAMADGSLPIANEQDLQQAVRLVSNNMGTAAARAHVVKRAKALNKEDLVPAEMLTLNELSFDQIYSQIRPLLATNHGEPGRSWEGYVEEIFPKKVIFSDRYDLYSQDYKVVNNTVQLTGSPIPVRRVTSYEARNPVTTNGEKVMTRAERVAAIITANVGWTDAERKVLEEMPDSQFAIIEKTAKSSQAVQTPPVVPAVVTPPVTQTQPVVNQGGQLTTEQYIASAPPEIRQFLQSAVAAQKAEQDRLIGVITANANNRFTPAFLATKSNEELTCLALLAGAGTVTQQQPQMTANGVPIYLGQSTAAGGQGQQHQMPAEGLALPTINYNNK